MKISELIEQLTEQMEVTGNTEVRVYDTLNEFDATVGEIRFCPDDGCVWIFI